MISFQEIEHEFLSCIFILYLQKSTFFRLAILIDTYAWVVSTLIDQKHGNLESPFSPHCRFKYMLMIILIKQKYARYFWQNLYISKLFLSISFVPFICLYTKDFCYLIVIFDIDRYVLLTYLAQYWYMCLMKLTL